MLAPLTGDESQNFIAECDDWRVAATLIACPIIVLYIWIFDPTPRTLIPSQDIVLQCQIEAQTRKEEGTTILTF